MHPLHRELLPCPARRLSSTTCQSARSSNPPDIVASAIKSTSGVINETSPVELRTLTRVNPPRRPPTDLAPPSYWWIKRCIDLYLSAVAAVVLAPLGLLLAAYVRRDSPGPALFRQVRAGRDGRPFTLLKFRTMRTDADPFGDSPQHGGDARITRAGRWLRESSLDELPQLLNVLRGEMSLVGPRPLYCQQAAEWTPRQRRRLLSFPGLTGLAQIRGRGALTIEEKLELDVHYVETLSLRQDALIVWQTLAQLWTRSGIYERRYSATQQRRSEARTGGQTPVR